MNKSNWKTWANLITFSGILSTLVYVFGYLTTTSSLTLPFAIYAGLTDGVDGWVARKLDQKSELGSFLDPVRDRLLIFAAVGNLIALYGLSGISTPIILIVLLELGIVAINYSIGFPKYVHPAGKIRMLVHCLTFGFLVVTSYIYPDIARGALKPLTYAAAVASFIACQFYLSNALSIRAKSPSR